MRTKNGIFRHGYIAAIVILAVALVVSLLLAVTFGTVSISVPDVYGVVLHKLFGIGDAELYGFGRLHDVVWLIRLPRLILAVAIGAALSVCGLVMQAVVKNPLADPYVLGISSGAYAGVSSAVLMGFGAALGVNAVPVMGFLGAFAASVVVVLLASIGGRTSPVKLILAGTAVGAVCSAFSNFLVYFSGESQRLQELVNWNMGSFARAKWDTNIVISIVVLAGIVFFWSQYRRLNLMLLGDESAVTLGTNPRRWRILYLLISSLITGFAVFSSGMIGFVGLVVPHAVRILFGADHKKLIPLCALVGAVFLVWADVFCRIVIEGAELPIGILTSIIGAPCFIFLIARKKYSFGGE